MSLPPSAEGSGISVYIPAYNVAEFLDRCIQSLLKQSLRPEEILVVDDGSKDDSAQIAAQYPGVTLIRHAANKGLAAARNTAMRAARCELVASIDADCIASASWLEELRRYLNDPEIGGVGGKLTEGVRDTLADRWRAVHMPQHWGDRTLTEPRFLFGCNTLFRKSAVLALGGYDERNRTNGEDTDICERLKARGWKLLYAPSANCTHLRHDTTRSILDAYWRWWRFGVNAYARGPRLRSVVGHALFVHFRYNFLEAAGKDFQARRWDLLAFDFLLLAYMPYRDFRLWWASKFGSQSSS